ncbi:Gp138 family membrane-puncturing spike protein [Entomobacter blattae]|uniref:Phage protein Gp138 N-terminal domain-containing protein n=1 Tax=Entomobacter blattae TaxID=2762277 RepID=A0A7H1NU39_9PROT|nr:Gp138 family membrane-puncturing spike protein [Entomobacter blattae]QNT79299.1 hypothetical protein JGUZn3_20960 [Entomobacter blattae]
MAQEKRYFGFATPAQVQEPYNAQTFHIDRHIKQNVNTSIPARVVKVDRAKRRLTCTPMVHQITPTGEAIPHGKIFDVPYGYVQGGNCLIQVDPVEGDIGFVCFSQRDISRVKDGFKDDAPETLRTHAWEDAVFIQNLHSDKSAEHIIRFDPDGGIELISNKPIKITGDLEVTGSITAQGDVKSGSISLQNHVHGGVETGSGTTGKAE